MIAFFTNNRAQESADEITKRMFAMCSPQMVCTDYWAAYQRPLASENHVQSKEGTQRIESFNACIRLRIKAFNRRTKCIFKSWRSIENALLIFFHRWNHQKRQEFIHSTSNIN